MKIHGYYVVRGNTLSIMMNEVNIMINKGWQPFGIFHCDDSGFYQPVVRDWK